jgi:hypothetical protein
MSQLPLLLAMLLIGLAAPATAETPLLICGLALAGLAPALLRRPD